MIVEVSSAPLTVTPARPSGDVPSRGTYGRVTAWLAKRVEFALAQVDLTLPQYRVLGILVEGSAAASGLAGRLAVRPSSVTAIIDGLVAKGLVDRTHQEDDRRRIALRLTEEGERVLAEADLTVDAYMVSIAGVLPGPDDVMVLRSLELWGQALTKFHQVRTAESK
jgi:long-chain acyl-CoA synthetase